MWRTRKKRPDLLDGVLNTSPNEVFDLRTLEGKNAYLYYPEDKSIVFLGNHKFMYGKLPEIDNSEVL